MRVPLLLGPATLLVGLAGYGLGVAYDLGLQRTAWGWVCFALALPLVPVYAWLGVGAGLPPDVGTLILLGVIAGTELAVANGLVDVTTDAGVGTAGIAVRLGLVRARLVMVATALGLLALAWLPTLLGAGLAGSDSADPVRPGGTGHRQRGPAGRGRDVAAGRGDLVVARLARPGPRCRGPGRQLDRGGELGRAISPLGRPFRSGRGRSRSPA